MASDEVGPQNFFAFKGYFPFGASKLNALQNNVRQRLSSDVHVFEDQQGVIDRAWNRDWTGVEISRIWNADVEDALSWNAFSVRLNSTMFVHATIDGEAYMFVHPNTSYSDLSKHLARYMDYFVCGMRDGAVTVLSASEWENVGNQTNIQFIEATLIKGSLIIEAVRRSNYVSTMPRGYFNARYAQECIKVSNQLHRSYPIITEIVMQQYTLDNQIELGDSPFVFDKFPLIVSIAETQAPRKTLCLLTTTTYGYYALKNTPPRLRTDYTSTFSPYSKTFMIEGVERMISDILVEYFSTDEYLPQLKLFVRTDTTQRVPAEMDSLLEEFQLRYETGVAALPDLDSYVKATCLIFLLKLEEDPYAFAQESMKTWMNTIDMNQHIQAMMKMSRTSFGFAVHIFASYMIYGASGNSALYTWFLSSGKLTKNRSRSMTAVHREFNVVAAPSSSLFFLRANLQSHVVSLSAYIFTILGVRIGGFEDSNDRDLVEKSTSACIEATVAMEILFPRIGFSKNILSSSSECGLLNDCRLWIAAWLFTFKIIVDRKVASQRIDAVLWSLKSKTLSNSRATDAEKDVMLFTRLFGLSYTNVPYIVGGLIPTLCDVRRYVEQYATETNEINFESVYDVQLDKLHWVSTEIVDDNYVPTTINYTDDVPASLYGNVVFGDEQLKLETTGDILRRVFGRFFDNQDTEQRYREFAARVHRKFANLYQTNSDDYRHIVEQLSHNSGRIGFEHTAPTQKKARKLASLVRKFKAKFQDQIDSLDSNSLLYVAWLVHSQLLREQFPTRNVAHAVSVIGGYTDKQPGTEGGGVTFSNVYNSLVNPETQAVLAMFDGNALDKLPVKKTTEAALSTSVPVQLIDVPLSFNFQVLTKVGTASIRYLEGFPIVVTHLIDDVLARQYSTYSDLVCRYFPTTNNEELVENIIDTVAVKYRNHFRLAPTTQGVMMSEARKNQFLVHLDSVSQELDGYLARDIAAKLTGQNRILRLVDDAQITHFAGHANEGLQHYTSSNRELVSVQAVELITTPSEALGMMGESSYGISHYFKYASIINADREAILLLRLLAASIHGNRSAFDFYAPIRGYIHSSLAGTPTLPENSTDNLYAWVGNYLTSRRGLSSAHHHVSNLTGYAPVIDAFTRNGSMYQMASAVEDPKYCVVTSSPIDDQHILTCDGENAQSFGTLAGEATRIEFIAYFTRPVHKDIGNTATLQFAQTIKTQIFSVDELYPVDEYAWFQFVDALPIASMPSTKLNQATIPTTGVPKTKRNRKRTKLKGGSRSRRLGAAISEVDPLFQRFTTLKIRIGTYKTLRNDNNDPNFRRDFVDFYIRAILLKIDNTEDVFIGSTDDYAACVRYYGTPVIEERNPADHATVSAFFERPEDIKIMPSSEFPDWRVAIFQRSTNSVVVAYAQSETDAVFSTVVDGAMYNSVKIPTAGDPHYNFFAMLRYIEVILSRPHNDYRLAPLTDEETLRIVDDVTGYFGMLDLALNVLMNPTSTREPDWRHRVYVQHDFNEEDRRSLQASGRDAYLSDNVITWFSSWLHLSYSRDNPFPHRKFEIAPPLLSQVIASGGHVIKQKKEPLAQLYLYPWVDRRRRHYFLVVVYFPLRIIFCIDSMVVRTRALLLNYAMRISQEYRSTKDLTKDDWTAIVPRRVPLQTHGSLSADFTMANVEYLVSWFMRDPTDFAEGMRVIDLSKEVYTPEQVTEVTNKAMTFRTNVLALASIAPQMSLPPDEEAVDDEEDNQAEIVDYEHHNNDDDIDPDFSIYDDNLMPSLHYQQDFNDESHPSDLGDDYVRVACKVVGYEISAQRYGNSLRHVRYGTNSNAVFVRKDRIGEHMPDERQLSYWELEPTNTIQSGAEVVARMPPGDAWKRFLMTGYPYDIDAHSNETTLHQAATGLVGPSFGLGACIFPLIRKFGSSYEFAASPLPLYRTRLVPE